MKVGLEIHQQLATGKLFCPCPSALADATTGEFHRRLHATLGETGTRDLAAERQAARGISYRYEVSPNSCLVEADEEPPRDMNRSALEVALTLADLLGSHTVDEIHTMRKTVVDGSNTSGFQRTALLATGGKLTVAGRDYSIASICLEEDAARKIRESPGEIVYRLDRLGIPLLEIATGPDMTSGQEAHDVAESLGALLRATQRVLRGLGTIREDLNVSIEGGSRVEIKGVQELRWISRYVDNEVARQTKLLEVREALRARQASAPTGEPVDLTAVFSGSGSRAIAEGLQKGSVVLALPLPGFGGLLGTSSTGPERLGRELADYARATGVGGIFHSDELPAYGISVSEVDRVRESLHLTGPHDAFALVCAPAARGRAALHAVRHRARLALEGVPEETRDPLAEGRTRYSRPLAGRHRMYPETDVPTLPVTPDMLEKVHRQLPELPQATLRRLERDWKLSPDVARKLVREGEVGLLDALVGAFPQLSGPLLARLLTQDLPPLEEQRGSPWGTTVPERLSLLGPVLKALEAGEFSKEGLPAVLERMVLHGKSLRASLDDLGLRSGSTDDLERITREVLAKNAELLRTKGREAFSPLMGDVMAQVRGRHDGKEVARVLRRQLEESLGPPGSRTA